MLKFEHIMTRLWICLITLLLNLLTGVYGYMIDQDCGDDTQFVQNKIDAAFRLIANAVTELNRNPINPDVDNWFNTLFGRPASQLPNSKVLVRMNALAAISQHNQIDQTVPGAPGQGVTDVRFYCTTKRITKLDDGRYINKNRSNLAYDPHELESRFAHCYDLTEPTLMITMRFVNLYTEIQICPWFLRKSRGFKVTDLVDTNQPFYATLSKLVIPVAAKILYTPIDVFILMDKVIVHELMHTHQAYPLTVDLGSEPYGFKNAVKLVRAWRGNPTEQNDPQRNADTNALFASGTWIIVAPGGSPIGPDGSFTTPQATPKARL